MHARRGVERGLRRVSQRLRGVERGWGLRAFRARPERAAYAFGQSYDVEGSGERTIAPVLAVHLAPELDAADREQHEPGPLLEQPRREPHASRSVDVEDHDLGPIALFARLERQHRDLDHRAAELAQPRAELLTFERGIGHEHELGTGLVVLGRRRVGHARRTLPKNADLLRASHWAMSTLVRVLGASTDEILLVLFLMALVLAGTKLGAAGDALGRWIDRRG